MKKVFALLLVLAMCFSLGALSVPAQAEGVLTIYTWADMFDPELLNAFEEEYNCKINYVNFDYDETMLAKLEAAGGGASGKDDDGSAPGKVKSSKPKRKVRNNFRLY